MGDWASKLGLRRATEIQSLRTAVAAVVSLLLAPGLKQPEFYQAPISTIVILLSPIDPMVLGWQRFGGTAMGAVLGALIASYFEPKWVVLFTALLRLRSPLSCWFLTSTGAGSWLCTVS